MKIHVSFALASLLVAGIALADTPRKSAGTDAPKRSIVLLHGAFAGASSWDKVIPLLQAKGFDVVAVPLPLTSLADDVATAKRVIEAQPGDVTLVGHSYGGMVITEAGNEPKVKSLVYVAAFVPDANESVNDLGKGQPQSPAFALLREYNGGFGYLPLEAVKKYFAQDVAPAEQNLIAVTQGPIRMKSFDDKVTTAAWKAKPSFYLLAELDHMIPSAAQEKMAKRANAKITKVKASHVPMVSQSRQVANAIITASAAQPVATR